MTTQRANITAKPRLNRLPIFIFASKFIIHAFLKLDSYSFDQAYVFGASNLAAFVGDDQLINVAHAGRLIGMPVVAFFWIALDFVRMKRC